MVHGDRGGPIFGWELEIFSSVCGKLCEVCTIWMPRFLIVYRHRYGWMVNS